MTSHEEQLYGFEEQFFFFLVNLWDLKVFIQQWKIRQFNKWTVFLLSTKLTLDSAASRPSPVIENTDVCVRVVCARAAFKMKTDIFYVGCENTHVSHDVCSAVVTWFWTDVKHNWHVSCRFVSVSCAWALTWNVSSCPQNSTPDFFFSSFFWQEATTCFTRTMLTWLCVFCFRCSMILKCLLSVQNHSPVQESTS